MGNIDLTRDREPPSSIEWKKGKVQRDLSAQLIELRLNLGMNQSQFAELIGVKQPFLSRLENGEQNITIQKFRRNRRMSRRNFRNTFISKRTHPSLMRRDEQKYGQCGQKCRQMRQ